MHRFFVNHIKEKKGELSNVPFLGLVISKVKEWIVAV